MGEIERGERKRERERERDIERCGKVGGRGQEQQNENLSHNASAVKHNRSPSYDQELQRKNFQLHD
jgi:hypothetical protein